MISKASNMPKAFSTSPTALRKSLSQNSPTKQRSSTFRRRKCREQRWNAPRRNLGPQENGEPGVGVIRQLQTMERMTDDRAAKNAFAAFFRVYGRLLNGQQRKGSYRCDVNRFRRRAKTTTPNAPINSPALQSNVDFFCIFLLDKAHSLTPAPALTRSSEKNCEIAFVSTASSLRASASRRLRRHWTTKSQNKRGVATFDHLFGLRHVDKLVQLRRPMSAQRRRRRESHSRFGLLTRMERTNTSQPM